MFGLLDERHARSLRYDAATDRATLTVDAQGAGGGAGAATPAALLLDAKGLLVGVDVEPEGPRRVVVMLGAHEAVATTRPTRVDVVRAADGEVVEVHIDGAKGLVGTPR
jgi:hypothetical protein